MIIGRGPEQTALTGLLTAAREGSPQTLLFAGDPGMGKTTLIDYAAGQASDFTVLRTTAIEAESEFPYAGLHELLLPVIAVLERIPEVQASALRNALALSSAPGSAPLVVGAGVLSTLATLSTERPVLCLVDNAQWLDNASAAAFLFAFRRLHAERVAVVVTQESQVPCTQMASGRAIVLNGLALEEGRQLLKQSKIEVSHRVANELWKSSGGNPAALQEAVVHLSSAQLSGIDPIPKLLVLESGAPRWLSHEVEKLSDDGRRALLHASIAGTVTHRIIHRDELAEGMAEAEEAGLVTRSAGQVAIAHRLTPAQVLQLSSAEERRTAHLHIAQALSDDGRHRELRLWHLAAAATGPDTDMAIEIGNGARELRSSHGHGSAVGLLETAARLTPDPPLRDAYTFDAARSAWLSGQPDRAADLLARMNPVPPDALVLSLSLLRRQMQWLAGSVLPHAPEPTAHSVDAETGVAWLIAESLSQDPQSSLELARQALDLARDAAPICAWAAELAVLRALDATGDAPSVRSAVQAAGAIAWEEATGRDELLIEVLQCLTIWTPTSAPWLVRALGRLHDLARQNTMAATPLASLAMGDFAFAEGRWSDAAIEYVTARSLAMDTGQGVTRGRADARIHMIQVLRGREDPARRPEGVPAAVGAAFAVAHAVAHAKPGDVVRSRSAVDWRALPTWMPPGSVSPVDLAEAAQRLDGTSIDVPAAVSAGQRAWISALNEPNPYEGLLNCLDFFGGDDGKSFPVGRLHTAIGRWQARHHQRAQARETLRRAQDIFVDLGCVGWVEQVHNELRATGLRVSALPVSELENLTPRELQVARCIVRGGTYKEAAAELFLSVKTIEWYLGIVYRKLEIKSRRDLSARLAELGEG